VDVLPPCRPPTRNASPGARLFTAFGKSSSSSEADGARAAPARQAGASRRRPPGGPTKAAIVANASFIKGHLYLIFSSQLHSGVVCCFRFCCSFAVFCCCVREMLDGTARLQTIGGFSFFWWRRAFRARTGGSRRRGARPSAGVSRASRAGEKRFVRGGGQKVVEKPSRLYEPSRRVHGTGSCGDAPGKPSSESGPCTRFCRRPPGPALDRLADRRAGPARGGYG